MRRLYIFEQNTELFANELIQPVKKDKQGIVWMLSLYGTAVGAGTLFLPIEAGLNGIWPLIIMSLLAFPMTYYSHQALCRFILSGSSSNSDITDVIKEHFGRFSARVLVLLYFFSIYPILLMYGVAITNTAQSFMVNQLGVNPPPRAILSLSIMILLAAIIQFGQKIIIKSMSVLVYPFIGVLFLISLYLIPHWNGSVFKQTASPHHLLRSLWLIVPIMVFSFNHSPIISSFSVSQKKLYGVEADKHCSRILKCSHLMMVITVMFFVFSCVLSLSPQDLALAKEQNISILSYLANHFNTPFIAFVAPLIALLAISKSFLGHYLGASEGLKGMFTRLSHSKENHVSSRRIQYSIDAFIVISCWICATINPNILTMIATLCGPLIAIILFLMPMYAINRLSKLANYRNLMPNMFIITIGLIALSAIFFSLWVGFH